MPGTVYSSSLLNLGRYIQFALCDYHHTGLHFLALQVSTLVRCVSRSTCGTAGVDDKDILLVVLELRECDISLYLLSRNYATARSLLVCKLDTLTATSNLRHSVASAFYLAYDVVDWRNCNACYSRLYALFDVKVRLLRFLGQIVELQPFLMSMSLALADCIFESVLQSAQKSLGIVGLYLVANGSPCTVVALNKVGIQALESACTGNYHLLVLFQTANGVFCNGISLNAEKHLIDNVENL